MFDPALTQFLNVHAGLGLAKVSRSLKSLACSDHHDIPASVRESLMAYASNIQIVSDHAIELIAVDVWKNGAKLGEQAAARAEKLKYPTLGDKELI